MSIETTNRFDLLDGMRGLAAIAVMVFHFTEHNTLHWLGGAWVAVDLFFILSGFVIAHSYGAKIMGGMTFVQFFLVRLIRLGPLYFLSLFIGLIAVVLSMRAGEFGGITSLQLEVATLLAALWLPYPNNFDWPFGNETVGWPIFPLNVPAWSLFFEIFVNAVFFIYVYRFRKLSSLTFVAVVAVIFFACTLLLNKANPGWGKYNFIYGFPRVVAEFFFGALIYQIGLHNKTARPVLTALLGLVVVLFVVFDVGARYVSITLIPLVFVLATSIKVEWERSRRFLKFLGGISYPLYIVHYPMYRVVWLSHGFQKMAPVMQTVVVSAICLIVAIILSSIDDRLRNILRNRASNLL